MASSLVISGIVLPQEAKMEVKTVELDRANTLATMCSQVGESGSNEALAAGSEKVLVGSE